jgi:hypothetical protein
MLNDKVFVSQAELLWKESKFNSENSPIALRKSPSSVFLNSIRFLTAISEKMKIRYNHLRRSESSVPHFGGGGVICVNSGQNRPTSDFFATVYT